MDIFLENAFENYDSIYDYLQECVNNDIYTEDFANDICDLAYNKYITEGVINPLKNKLKELKKIKDTKPEEYSGPEEVKEYVDKYYDKIVKISKILEEEPRKISKATWKWLIGSVIAIIVGVAAMIIFPMGVVEDIAMYTGILALVSLFIGWVPIYMRVQNDYNGVKDLIKIKKALQKLDKIKLPENYKKKISALISKIDDVENEWLGKLKNND